MRAAVVDKAFASVNHNCAMADKIHCEIHGENQSTYVCSHLVGDAAGLGFNSDEPTEDNPFPDAWCDNCELIRAATGDWDDESQELVKISLLCSRCYERARIRNTRASVGFDDLASLRWKCSSCDEWHTGPCLDFSYSAPFQWTKDDEEASRLDKLLPAGSKKRGRVFLDEDYCATSDAFFVRGIIHLPIIGCAETFRWGVWGSLSRANFEILLSKQEDPGRTELPPMFSWLCNRIPEYPDTLSMKMYAHIQEPGSRPSFELEATSHPLSLEYHKGITPERVREIMISRLRQTE